MLSRKLSYRNLSSHDGTWTYQGLIDDVRLYDRALNVREVRKIFNLK